MVSARRGVEGARLTTSLAAFVVNRRGNDASTRQGPGRFARPQSSQQIGALPACRQGGGKSAKYSGIPPEADCIGACGPLARYQQRYFAVNCPVTTE